MVMPLWDENPFTKPAKPWVTWTLIALNIFIFIVQLGSGVEGEDAIFKTYALVPAAVSNQNTLAGIIPADMPLVTYMFLHGDIFHLLSNMIFLFVFGDNIEEAMGAVRYTVFYLLCGIGGGLAFTLSDPQSTVPLVGASAAISGIIAGYAMLRPCAKIRVLVTYFVVQLAAFWVIGAWGVLQLFQLAAQPDDGVAYWGHIGGVIAGALLFPPMRRPGVDLFECIEPREMPLETPPMPDSSGLPGRPREPTVR
jgi:membrane associated rhomboid family serine protease